MRCIFCGKIVEVWKLECDCEENQKDFRFRCDLAELRYKYSILSRKREEAESEMRRLDRECYQVRQQEQEILAKMTEPRTPKKEATRNPPETPAAPKKQRVKRR